MRSGLTVTLRPSCSSADERLGRGGARWGSRASGKRVARARRWSSGLGELETCFCRQSRVAAWTTTREPRRLHRAGGAACRAGWKCAVRLQYARIHGSPLCARFAPPLRADRESGGHPRSGPLSWLARVSRQSIQGPVLPRLHSHQNRNGASMASTILAKNRAPSAPSSTRWSMESDSGSMRRGSKAPSR